MSDETVYTTSFDRTAFGVNLALFGAPTIAISIVTLYLFSFSNYSLSTFHTWAARWWTRKSWSHAWHTNAIIATISESRFITILPSLLIGYQCLFGAPLISLIVWAAMATSQVNHLYGLTVGWMGAVAWLLIWSMLRWRANCWRMDTLTQFAVLAAGILIFPYEIWYASFIFDMLPSPLNKLLDDVIGSCFWLHHIDGKLLQVNSLSPNTLWQLA
jgi:hypothetical protein